MRADPYLHKPVGLSDPRTNPFILLAVTPSTSRANLEAAHTAARELQLSSEEVLLAAAEELSDPGKRLPHELSFPLDGRLEDIQKLCQALSSDATDREVLRLVKDYAPLSKFNALSYLATRGAASDLLLIAFIKAQAAISAHDIYELLKEQRKAAGLPAPALIDVSQSLQNLISERHRNIVSAYAHISDAAAALLICAEHCSASDRHQREVLTQLVAVYQNATVELRTNACIIVHSAIAALDQPSKGALVKQLSRCLRDYLSLAGPIIVSERAGGRADEEAATIAASLRNLLSRLSEERNYEVAREIAKECLEAFAVDPATAAQFKDPANILGQLAAETALTRLKETIERVEALALRDPSSTQNLSDVWLAFDRASDACVAPRQDERLWIDVRDFGTRLAERPISLQFARNLISELLERARAANLDEETMKSITQAAERTNLERSARREAQPGNRTPIRTAVAIVAILLLGIGVGFLISSHLSQRASAPQPQTVSTPPTDRRELGAIPPVGSGQRFSREFVRYCEFQKQRLQVIKQHVQWREDIAAYNTLANDYNSRCSNYFFQDEDLKAVLQEVATNRDRLESEAKQVLANWPWRANTEVAPTASTAPK